MNTQPATAAPTATRTLSSQAKLLAALFAVVGIVLASPLSPIEIAAVVVIITALGIISEASLKRMYLRSLLVLPVAGTMALFTPLKYVETWSASGLAHAFAVGWPEALGLIITPWLCVLTMMLFAENCPPEKMLYALEKLHTPHALVLLLTFIYRYVDTLRAQVISMRRALISRAPALSAYRQVLLYGNLAGALLIRAYDRGDRIYFAMLSRGFTGTLPRSKGESFSALDAGFLLVTLVFAIALMLYR